MLGAVVGSMLSYGVGTALKAGSDYVKGSTSNYFAEKRARDQAELDYAYAQRYAENSPSWSVKGLRNAGLNPILAASSGFSAPNWKPSVTSAPDTNSGNIDGRFDPLTLQNVKMVKNQNKSVELDNKLKLDNLKTVKAENEVKRLKAEAEADLLRPWTSSAIEGDGKEVAVQIPSDSFKALQKAIADDYDLRSEKYVRETLDAVMKYGTDVLKLLPAFRRKEILDTIQKSTKIDSKGRKTSTETYTTHSPR